MAWCGVIVHYEVFPADVDPTQASLPLPTLMLLIDRVGTEKSRINILSDIDVSMFYYIKIPFSSMPDWWPDIKSVELARDSQVVASLFIANGGLEMRMQPVISGGGGSLPLISVTPTVDYTGSTMIPGNATVKLVRWGKVISLHFRSLQLTSPDGNTQTTINISFTNAAEIEPIFDGITNLPVIAAWTPRLLDNAEILFSNVSINKFVVKFNIRWKNPIAGNGRWWPGDSSSVGFITTLLLD